MPVVSPARFASVNDGENIQMFELTNVYLRLKELFYQNNNVHLGPIYNLK